MSSTDDRGLGTRAAVASRKVARLRATVGRIAAEQVEQLRAVVEVAEECAAAARRELAGVPPGWGVPSEDELIHSTVTHEVMVILAIAKWEAEKLVERATRLVQVLPDTLAAVEAGRIDLKRAEVLAEETAVLDDGLARQVEALVLQQIADNDGPWQGLSPRRWRSQIQRAVVEADIDAARRRREAVILLRAVRAWAQADGSGVLQVIGQDADIAVIDAVITDLALAWPAVDADGNPLSMDERRFDALMDLFRRVEGGADLPWVRIRRDREIGLVLHSDAFFGDGPGKDAPGELRGLGQPAPVDPVSAAEMARAQIEAGAPTRVLLVDGDCVVERTIRLPEAPPGGWTRDLLAGSVRKALPDLPSLLTESYQPTVAITEHVRAVHPRCTSYDCARLASRCDLDHDQAYPRGPTCVTNLCPRCRRHHELKTRGLVHTRQAPRRVGHHHNPARHHRHNATGATTRPRPRRGLRPLTPAAMRCQAAALGRAAWLIEIRWATTRVAAIATPALISAVTANVHIGDPALTAAPGSCGGSG